MKKHHLMATILFSLILGAHAFSYKDATNWGEKYSKCNGKNQSPIFMDSSNIYKESPSGSKKLKLAEFDKIPTKMTIKNTGHTVELRAEWSGKPMEISGGTLHGSYVFEKITFHWAQKAKESPEETAPRNMEMHMYFYKKKLKSFKRAESQKDGLAIFNVIMPVGPVTSGVTFDDLAKSLKKVESINSTADIPPFPITSAVHPVPAYLTYKGSLDYPPCSESATWFFYDSQVFISADLLNGFRKVKLVEGDVSNLRHEQAPNNRKIMTIATE